MQTAAGYNSVEKAFDENGRVIVERFVDGAGNAVIAQDKGYAIVTHEYDEKGQETRTAWYDNNEALIMVSGAAVVEKEYDDAGNVVVTKKYDNQGNMIFDPKGYAYVRKDYNDQKQVIRETFCNADGSAFTGSSDGYAVMTKSYDEAGNVASQSYFDADGTPILLPAGYHTVEKEYDQNKKPVKTAYFDTDGKRVAGTSNGSAVIRNEYDDKGNVTYEAYYDTDDKPLTLAAGYAGLRKVYNEQNKVIRTEYLGENGEPIALENGTAVLCYDYDDAGNIISETYLDLSGNRHTIESPNPDKYYAYAEIRKFYNENNKVVETEYCTADNMFANGPSGFAIQTFEYDDQGRQIRTSWFDQSKTPYVSSKGYVTMSSSYAEDGTKTDTYYDAAGNVVVMQ